MSAASTQYANPVKAFIENVINQNNNSELNHYIAPHYHYQSGDVTLQGRDELRALLKDYRKAFPDIHIHIDEQVKENERIVTRGKLSGTQRGAFQGLPATNIKISVDIVLFSRIEKELITEEWEIIDELAIMQQLGALHS